MTASINKKYRDRKPPMKKALVLRVDLDEELKNQFEAVKKRYNLNSNTEVLRFCISQTFTAETLDIPSDLKDKIKWIIKHPVIREREAIHDFNDFARRSLSFYLQKMKKSLGDLNDWSFRERLPEDERDVANAIILQQAQDSSVLGVTISELKKNLGEKISESKIQAIVNKFVDLSVLSMMKHQGITYYHTSE
ncbi:MAG: hypothetical protein ACTSP4_04450 [Candidatus Hodarchaeales archaeon]